MEKKTKGLIGEFKEFISKGSVLDMAVGVIIGGAFTAIITSLVDDIFMPLISLITGGIDFTTLCVTFGSGENAATLNYGAFIAAIINFLLIALVLFLVIKGINKFRKEKPADPTTKTCPHCQSEIPIKATRCPHCTSELDK
ncbi:MAG: large conductance mechanosensitive channel protein MscL [Lachnospiraceae bacterium]|nr:large conductance mechanosensitive channel protein MscL [Lachnospiraceae bacterium]